MRIFDVDAPEGEYERLVAVQDAASGLRALLVLHSTLRGPAYGGIRRWPYGDEAQALDDARRLAAAMSRKCALAGLPAGGAKTVILERPGLDVPRAYEALGRVVESLGGSYVCGPDVGTSDADLSALRRVTRYVNPAGNDAGRSTAEGVLAAISGLLAARAAPGPDLHGPDLRGSVGPRGVWTSSVDAAPWAGLRFGVLGLGAVGTRVAAGLVERGGEVVAFDPDPRARARGEALGLGLAPDEVAVLELRCDVLVPCALGGVLTAERVDGLGAAAVCGSANNVVASLDVAEQLHQRGVLLVPDVVSSAGAVIEGVITMQHGWGTAVSDDARAAVERAIAAIAPRVTDVLRESARLQLSPARVVELHSIALLSRHTPGAADTPRLEAG